VFPVRYGLDLYDLHESGVEGLTVHRIISILELYMESVASKDARLCTRVPNRFLRPVPSSLGTMTKHRDGLLFSAASRFVRLHDGITQHNEISRRINRRARSRLAGSRRVSEKQTS
jgi:hypothetical protein